ncbi:uncharacterized protein EV154DRAFT_485955 [Mucor mucedo]|uniref:uncharacterized protein n=1 Tax=Mucor mucedo TaxID=29922 RepID=UPI002220CB94|nr:uncharacterized protein EV154DRAFT_485955 [Mucor mucedo]KAI7880287.1 hypothetical protein EV154DRAFT_485955 [Mucor mucedo]
MVEVKGCSTMSLNGFNKILREFEHSHLLKAKNTFTIQHSILGCFYLWPLTLYLWERGLSAKKNYGLVAHLKINLFCVKDGGSICFGTAFQVKRHESCFVTWVESASFVPSAFVIEEGHIFSIISSAWHLSKAEDPTWKTLPFDRLSSYRHRHIATDETRLVVVIKAAKIQLTYSFFCNMNNAQESKSLKKFTIYCPRVCKISQVII